LSTAVDKADEKSARARRVPAAQTRARILDVARGVFCQAGFDQVGVRELALASKVDPAVVIRLFGSKEALFAAVAADAFALESPFCGPLAGLGSRIAQVLTAKLEACDQPERFDAFQFLLRSAASPTAAPILSASLHAGFIGPLAAHLGGRNAETRAALLTACVLGFATLRVALTAPALEGEASSLVMERLGIVLQACLDAV
jgi:AcrR family transcriptional regulator